MSDGGTYQVRVQGRISERWAHWFEEMSMDADAAGTTVLTGAVADQAALLGLLQKLYTLGMPLLSVSRVESGDAEHEEEILRCAQDDTRGIGCAQDDR